MASFYIVFIFIGLVKAQNSCEYGLHIFITQTIRDYVLHIFCLCYMFFTFLSHKLHVSMSMFVLHKLHVSMSFTDLLHKSQVRISFTF